MRMTRILDVLSKPEVVVAVLTLAHEDRSQQELLRAVEASGIGQIDQPTMSRHLSRLEDLGLIGKPGKRGAYQLVHPERTVSLVNAALALASATTGTEAELEATMQRLARRSILRAVEADKSDGAASTTS